LNSLETKQNKKHVELLRDFQRTAGFTRRKQPVKIPKPSRQKVVEYGRVISDITDPRFDLFKEIRPHLNTQERCSNKIDVPEFVQKKFKKDPQLIESTIKLLDFGVNPHAL
jgi:hypothetical protein